MRKINFLYEFERTDFTINGQKVLNNTKNTFNILLTGIIFNSGIYAAEVGLKKQGNECGNSFTIGTITKEFYKKSSEKLENMDSIFKNIINIPKNNEEIEQWRYIKKINSNYKNIIIPIDNIKDCKGTKDNVDTLGFFSPKKDIIGILYKKYGDEAISSIYHEAWHSIYDNTGEKKGLIYQKGYEGPGKKEIDFFVKNYFLQRKDIQNTFFSKKKYIELQKFYSELEIYILEINKVLKLAQKDFNIFFENFEKKVTNFNNELPFYKFYLKLNINNRAKEDLKSLISRKLLKPINLETNTSIINLSKKTQNIIEEFKLLSKYIKVIKKLLIIEKRIKKDLEEEIKKNNLNINISILEKNINNLYLYKKILEEYSKNTYIQSLLKEGEKNINGLNSYEKELKEYYFLPNEIMARIIESLYTKSKDNTKNHFILDKKTLDFLRKFKVNGTNIFEKGIKNYNKN